jgi:hypothetical protein
MPVQLEMCFERRELIARKAMLRLAITDPMRTTSTITRMGLTFVEEGKEFFVNLGDIDSAAPPDYVSDCCSGLRLNCVLPAVDGMATGLYASGNVTARLIVSDGECRIIMATQLRDKRDMGPKATAIMLRELSEYYREITQGRPGQAIAA